MAKVLHIRLDSPPGYNSAAIEKGFIENGHSYSSVDWQVLRFQFGVEQMRKIVLHEAGIVQPDIIFCHIQNPDAFDKETWVALSKIGFVINYTFDVRIADEMLWAYNVAPLIGYTFFGSRKDIELCHKLGIKNVGHSHSSCDMDVFKPMDKNVYAFDVVFCGNKYENTNLNFPMAAQRERMIERFDDSFRGSFMSYGLGHKGGLIQPGVEASVYNFSRIGLNQNNFNLVDYSSDRLWRIMASGCFCLTFYFPGIERIFEKEKHLDWATGIDEMELLAKFYLKEDDERKSIAKCGMNYVRENHTWTNRISEMFNQCKF